MSGQKRKNQFRCSNCGKAIVGQQYWLVGFRGCFCGSKCVLEAHEGKVPRFARPVAVGALKAGSR